MLNGLGGVVYDSSGRIGSAMDEQLDRSADKFFLSDTDIGRVSVKVVESLLPLLNKIYHKVGVEPGILHGFTAIGRYWGEVETRNNNITSKAVKYDAHRKKFMRWFEEKGFPLCLDPSGYWFTTKSLIDSWIMQRSRFIRKAREMGIKPVKTHGSSRGCKYITPENISPADKVRVFRALAMEGAKREVVGG